MKSAAITFQDVTFGFGKPIFQNLNVQFMGAKWHTLIGPNAAGKTTLLRLAAGVHKPAGGTVTVGDSQISSLPPRERAQTVAVVPQFETNVFPLLVEELVATGRYCRQQGYFAGRPDEVVEQVLKRVGALHLKHRSVWELSGGERQRVLIARALAQESSWIFLDEATTFLDLRAEYELLHLLEELHSEGLSILSVTHDLQAASRADVVTLITKGDIVQGSAEEILTPERLSSAYGIPFYVEKRPGQFLIGLHR